MDYEEDWAEQDALEWKLIGIFFRLFSNSTFVIKGSSVHLKKIGKSIQTMPTS